MSSQLVLPFLNIMSSDRSSLIIYSDSDSVLLYIQQVTPICEIFSNFCQYICIVMSIYAFSYFFLLKRTFEVSLVIFRTLHYGFPQSYSMYAEVQQIVSHLISCRQAGLGATPEGLLTKVEEEVKVRAQKIFRQFFPPIIFH